MSPTFWRNVQSAMLALAYVANGWFLMVEQFSGAEPWRLFWLHLLAGVLCFVGLVRLERQREHAILTEKPE